MNNSLKDEETAEGKKQICMSDCSVASHAGWKQAEKAFYCYREKRNSHTVTFHPTSVVTMGAR